MHEPPTTPAPLAATIAQGEGAGPSAGAFLTGSLEGVAGAAAAVAYNLTVFQRVDNATIERTAMSILTGGVAQAPEATGRLFTIAGWWTNFGATAVAGIRDYAATQVAVWAAQSAPNDRVVSLWPVTSPVPSVLPDQPPILTQGPAPVAHVQRGWYAFQVQILDNVGTPVAWSTFDLDVFGLEALPGHGQADVPGAGSYTPPVRSTHLLYSTHVGGPTSASNGTRLDPGACAAQVGCAVVHLPASALRLQRLYAGAPVLVRVRLTDDLVGWHSALADLATQAAATAPITPDDVHRLRAIADQLDQFPTPVILAGPKDATSEDPDLDAWPTTAELAWNSDPFDYLSRPGSDDDADGHANFAETSRARAAGWPDDVPESAPAQDAVPVPFVGRTILVNEQAPAASDVPTSEVERLQALPVLAAAVAAGPGAFTLQGLTLRNVAPRPLEAGTPTGLQRLDLFRTDTPAPTLLATWGFTAPSWRLDDAPAGVSLDCGVCDAKTTTWTLAGLQEPGEGNIPLLAVAQVSPRGTEPDTYDSAGFQAELDPAETIVALEATDQAVEAVGPAQRAPLQRLDVRAGKLVLTSASATGLVAGRPFALDICARDAFANLDRDYGGPTPRFLWVSASEGASPSPRGDPPTPDLRAPVLHRIQSGCVQVGADVVSESPRPEGLTLFRAGENVRIVAVDATTGLRGESAPPIVAPAAPAVRILQDPAPTGPRRAVPASADAGRVTLTFAVADAYGNRVGEGVPVVVQVGHRSTTHWTDAVGEARADIDTGRVAGTSHEVAATCFDVPLLRQEIVVVAGAPARLQAVPASPEVRPGAHVALLARAWDAHGNVVGPVSAEWSIVAGQGDLDPGRIEYRAPATNTTAVVRARLGGLTSDATIHIVPEATGRTSAIDAGPNWPAVPQPLLLLLALVGAGAALVAKKARVLVVMVHPTKTEMKLVKVRTADEIPRIAAGPGRTSR